MKKEEIKNVLFLGVGGISMYQLALAYKSMGYNVIGYDIKSSKYTKLCEEHGIAVCHRFSKAFTNVDLAVKTGAIKDDNKFVTHLKLLKVPIMDRAECLGEICKQFNQVIAVAGTHGKSTTSSLIYEILRAAHKKVSCHIGADVFAPRFVPGDEFLVVEACEYNKSFLSLYPTISVVTNVEAEHMDSYKSLFNLKSAFLTFAKRGSVRFAHKNKTTEFLAKVNVNFVETGSEVPSKIRGYYNQNNIALALAVTTSLGVDEKLAKKVVKNFDSVPRRYELIGKVNTTQIYIDYAHHPTEIEAFVNTFNKNNYNSLIVFQPHTYSRTKTFLANFVRVFSKLENLIIFKEYPAREKPSAGLSAHKLYLEIKKINPKVKYCATAKKVAQNLNKFKAAAFVGAGDINQIAQKIVKTS